MQITSRERVRQAVANALKLDPSEDEEAAIHSAAQALGIDVEWVREALGMIDEEVV